ncbi:uncharacterized protein LOC115753344 [Rhodamnia argentea]|uniref:Uncharacterized protein LOC115753344 n=1 Tax=Rhodamnia argentea TaxID=178133 RepID=A0ABM3HET9_9MYRT|nr:uncharacterized protein LOC115753344 [Rhodamnia argentea]
MVVQTRQGRGGTGRASSSNNAEREAISSKIKSSLFCSKKEVVKPEGLTDNETGLPGTLFVVLPNCNDDGIVEDTCAVIDAEMRDGNLADDDGVSNCMAKAGITREPKPVDGPFLKDTTAATPELGEDNGLPWS